MILRDLIKDESLFEWTDAHEKEWDSVKRALVSSPILAFYDPKLKTKVSTDASQFGLGAALLQLHGSDWRPVAYTSRVLTDAEKRYSQIEKEALGNVFGCEQFHEFVYGQRVLVETDHKPLIAISKKALGDMPPRLQRFFLRMMKYDYELKFVPGRKLLLADMLSRAPLMERRVTSNVNDDVTVHAVSMLSALVTDKTLERLREETAKDLCLREVVDALENYKEVQGEYKPFQSELSVISGIVLKGTKVVIPRTLRMEMLKRVHEGHLGISKCKARARSLMFWPGMSAAISDMVARCASCKRYAYRQQEEPLIMRPTPQQPWYRVGADLCQHAGKNYLVVYDATSNYPEVEELRDTTARTVVNRLATIFARHGIPMEVCTDNGPQFVSKDFKDFATLFDFHHTTSSPRFPRANGLAEKGVQIVKRILKKTAYANESFALGLLSYRTMPLEDGRSPAEILMGRRIRSRLPDFTDGLKVSVSKHQQNPLRGTPLKVLQPGDTVRLQQNSSWATTAKVQDVVGPRSYRVLTEDNQELRRNRQHLLRTSEDFTAAATALEDGMGSCRDRSRPSNGSEYQLQHTASVPAGNEGITPTPGNDFSVPEEPALRRSTRVSRPPDRLTYY